ncbi:UPF0676 protein C1494.01-like [Stylophora pistillata]|uniref:UPF0676 protein C1494.01-like n=1 Tax=Stylophora pistillata TaxID=50429 RepID=UPI000C03C78F|nr:UPF0676 protein C1494.01-like [Stylophora pistillata]XP_022798490.1 UPF0676 protein C1494.01-like [Stylophora pistillata]
MAAAACAIPVVDFSAMSLKNNDPPDKNSQAIKTLADQLYQAFSTIGFVYLKNHGIPQEELDAVFKTFDKFFSLSPEVKAKYAKKKITSQHVSSQNGWDAIEVERTSLNRPGDLKESLDLESFDDGTFNWPSAEVPQFKSTVSSFYKSMSDLALRILTVMAIGLQLEPNTFTKFFNKVGTTEGAVQMRFNAYPKISDLSKVKPGQIRCGEHTDYGAISVLFQDDIGGLEVQNVNGQFIPATPMKGTVVVNIADLMQRWTADKLKSTVHRVLIPEAEHKHSVPRRSLVLFVDPDHDTLIECVDGSNKYPPITSGEWKRRRLLETYTDLKK